MALPANVAAQMVVLNSAVNKILADRETLDGLFDDRLGGSVWSLLTTQNQSAVKTAIINDMTAARDSINGVITALNSF